MKKAYEIANSDFRESTKQGFYLTTFSFIRGTYGLRISVIGCMILEETPSPDFVRGKIEINKEKIFVVDPKVLNGLEPTPVNGQTCIVIVEPELNGRKIKLGIIVQDVSEVLNIASSKLDKDQSSKNTNIDFILQLGNKDENLLLLKKMEPLLKLR